MTPMEIDFARWVKRHGGRFRLRQLAGTRYIYEYRKFASHLRREGWVVDVTEHRRAAGSNLYTIIPPNNDWTIVPDVEKRPGRPTNEEVREKTEPLLPFIEA